MKLGIIGTGMIVRHFLPVLAGTKGLEINAILSTPRSLAQAEEFSKEYNIPLWTDDFDLFKTADIDSVYVAVPNHLHYNFCRKAMESGLNVIVEKPIASNARETEDLCALAEEKGLFLFEAITTLYLKSYQKVKEWLPRIGTIKIAQSQYSQYSSRYNAFRAGEVLPAFDPQKSGGAMMDLNLYNIFFIAGLFGKPESMQYSANVERGIDTSGILMMQYPGFQALCIAAKDSRGLRQSVIQGTDGVITFDGSANVGGKVTLDLYDGTKEEYEVSEAQERAALEFGAFIKAINSGDMEFCRKQLTVSVMVSRIMTEARIIAGVIFPADRN